MPQELAEAAAAAALQPGETRRLPKGTSAYQAAWIVDDEAEGDGGSDGEELEDVVVREPAAGALATRHGFCVYLVLDLLAVSLAVALQDAQRPPSCSADPEPCRAFVPGGASAAGTGAGSSAMDAEDAAPVLDDDGTATEADGLMVRHGSGTQLCRALDAHLLQRVCLHPATGSRSSASMSAWSPGCRC